MRGALLGFLEELCQCAEPLSGGACGKLLQTLLCQSIELVDDLLMRIEMLGEVRDRFQPTGANGLMLKR
ncbi:hypothetical protein D7X55_34675 [Corallococcus sp. AB049A]|nr:hypothetical protein D7X55_34675 [Corallococcus sp. AB049A]